MAFVPLKLKHVRRSVGTVMQRCSISFIYWSEFLKDFFLILFEFPFAAALWRSSENFLEWKLLGNLKSSELSQEPSDAASSLDFSCNFHPLCSDVDWLLKSYLVWRLLQCLLHDFLLPSCSNWYVERVGRVGISSSFLTGAIRLAHAWRSSIRFRRLSSIISFMWRFKNCATGSIRSLLPTICWVRSFITLFDLGNSWELQTRSVPARQHQWALLQLSGTSVFQSPPLQMCIRLELHSQ